MKDFSSYRQCLHSSHPILRSWIMLLSYAKPSKIKLKPPWHQALQNLAAFRSFVVVQALSHVQFFATRGPWPARLLCPWDSPGRNTGVGCHFLLQEISLNQGSIPGLLCYQVDSLPLTTSETPWSLSFLCSHPPLPRSFISQIKLCSSSGLCPIRGFVILPCLESCPPSQNPGDVDLALKGRLDMREKVNKNQSRAGSGETDRSGEKTL